jgi:hypothetical protein
VNYCSLYNKVNLKCNYRAETTYLIYLFMQYPVIIAAVRIFRVQSMRRSKSFHNPIPDGFYTRQVLAFVRLSLFKLLGEIVLKPDLLDLVQLGLEPINVIFLVLEVGIEELA